MSDRVPGTDMTPREAAERMADIIVHAVGIALAAGGAGWLITQSILNGSGPDITGSSVYAACLLAALTCSLLYNAAHPSPRKDLLRRFDHAAIYLLIAGTYTAFMAHALDSTPIVIALASMWVLALGGAALKLFAPLTPSWAGVVLYLALGWSGAIIFEPLREALGLTVLVIIGIGGALYSIGVIFHLWERLPYRRAVWHGFVVAAAATHFSAVAMALAG